MYYEFKVQIYADNEEEAKKIFNSVKEIKNKLLKSVLWKIERKVINTN